MPERANPDVVIELLHPVEAGGAVITELAMRRPTMEGVRTAAGVHVPAGFNVGVSRLVALVADLAAVPVSVVDEIYADDFQRIADVLYDFLRALPAADALDSGTLH